MIPSSVTKSAVVTCGPGYARVDAVRRITNFSSGELGSLLCAALLGEGFEVVCLRGEGATVPLPGGVREVGFGTNADLLRALDVVNKEPDFVFHAAALADFEVDVAALPRMGKLRSTGGPLTLSLVPAQKILPRIRGFFPKTCIVGWKYEVDGTPRDAIARGIEQLAAYGTDACVVNGPAHGAGFTFLMRGGAQVFAGRDKASLAGFLSRWAAGRESVVP